jgi:ABC-2 type transport system ATP-binding protein
LDAIRATGLTKRYGKTLAVDHVELSVPAGEVFGFLGPNGAGKSTTTKMLATLLPPTEGRAEVAGYDIHSDPLGVRGAIGYLPERMPIYRTMTGREYLDTFARMHHLPKAERAERAERLLTLVNLPDIRGKRVGEFSKGMMQRLGLARALINDPKVLFLDEPASGLDPTGRKEIRTLMQSLARGGMTIFLCTHDLAEAQAVCDRIGFIRGGQLVKVQRVGEVATDTRRVLLVELDGLSPAIEQAVRAVEGVIETSFSSPTLTISFRDPASRPDLARAIQKAGGVILGVEEKVPSVEALYEQYVEKPREAGSVAEIASTIVPTSPGAPREGEKTMEPARTRPPSGGR